MPLTLIKSICTSLCFLLQTNNSQKKVWAHSWRDLNPRPSEHRADALSTELQELLARSFVMFLYRLVSACLRQLKSVHKSVHKNIKNDLAILRVFVAQWIINK